MAKNSSAKRAPRVPGGAPPKKTIVVRVSEPLREALERESERTFRSRCFVIRKLLCEALNVPFVEFGVELDVVPSGKRSGKKP